MEKEFPIPLGIRGKRWEMQEPYNWFPLMHNYFIQQIGIPGYCTTLLLSIFPQTSIFIELMMKSPLVENPSAVFQRSTGLGSQVGTGDLETGLNPFRSYFHSPSSSSSTPRRTSSIKFPIFFQAEVLFVHHIFQVNMCNSKPNLSFPGQRFAPRWVGYQHHSSRAFPSDLFAVDTE